MEERKEDPNCFSSSSPPSCVVVGGEGKLGCGGAAKIGAHFHKRRERQRQRQRGEIRRRGRGGEGEEQFAGALFRRHNTGEKKEGGGLGRSVGRSVGLSHKGGEEDDSTETRKSGRGRSRKGASRLGRTEEEEITQPRADHPTSDRGEDSRDWHVALHGSSEQSIGMR